MNATNQQIVELAKRGFSSEQIEQALSLAPGAAASILSKDNEAMRAVEKNGLEGKFANLQEAALETLKFNLNDDNGSVRQRAVELILKQGLGLMKPKVQQTTVNNNLVFLVERAAKAKSIREATVVDV